MLLREVPSVVYAGLAPSVLMIVVASNFPSEIANRYVLIYPRLARVTMVRTFSSLIKFVRYPRFISLSLIW